MRTEFITDPGFHRTLDAKITRQSDNECWFWNGAISNTGYGRFWYQGVAMYAHRVVLSIKIGRILQRHEYACHLCDNPACCNPAHLWLGSHESNMLDMKIKRRAAHGERHASARLSEADVTAIRAMFATGRFTKKEIAHLFGVTDSPIRAVIAGRTWSEVGLDSAPLREIP